MNTEDRVHHYAKLLNVERLKTANAYIRFLSYRSKLKDEELKEALTQEDLKTIQEANEKMLLLIKRMNRFYERAMEEQDDSDDIQ